MHSECKVVFGRVSQKCRRPNQEEVAVVGVGKKSTPENKFCCADP